MDMDIVHINTRTGKVEEEIKQSPTYLDKQLPR